MEHICHEWVDNDYGGVWLTHIPGRGFCALSRGGYCATCGLPLYADGTYGLRSDQLAAEPDDHAELREKAETALREEKQDPGGSHDYPADMAAGVLALLDELTESADAIRVLSEDSRGWERKHEEACAELAALRAAGATPPSDNTQQLRCDAGKLRAALEWACEQFEAQLVSRDAECSGCPLATESDWCGGEVAGADDGPCCAENLLAAALANADAQPPALPSDATWAHRAMWLAATLAKVVHTEPARSQLGWLALADEGSGTTPPAPSVPVAALLEAIADCPGDDEDMSEGLSWRGTGTTYNRFIAAGEQLVAARIRALIADAKPQEGGG